MKFVCRPIIFEDELGWCGVVVLAFLCPSRNPNPVSCIQTVQCLGPASVRPNSSGSDGAHRVNSMSRLGSAHPSSAQLSSISAQRDELKVPWAWLHLLLTRKV